MFRLRKNLVEGGVLLPDDYIKHQKDLYDLFLSIGGKDGRTLSPITIKNYANKFNRLNVLVEGKVYSGNLDWIYDSEKVLKTLETSDLLSKKDYLSPILNILKHQKADEKIILAYNKGLSAFKNTEDNLRKDNLPTPKEKVNSMHLPEVQRRIKAFQPENDAELVQKLICSFYFLNDNLTPRNDLWECKLVSNTKKMNKMSDEYNYIVVNKEMKSEGIIMNNYKTSKTYGRQKFDISPDLKKVLDEYISEYKKQTGDFLFVMKDGSQFKENNFRDVIESSMEHVIGVPININLVRKIKITEWYSVSRPHTINENEKFARSLLHSVNVAQEYIKPSLFDGDE